MSQNTNARRNELRMRRIARGVPGVEGTILSCGNSDLLIVGFPKIWLFSWYSSSGCPKITKQRGKTELWFPPRSYLCTWRYRIEISKEKKRKRKKTRLFLKINTEKAIIIVPDLQPSMDVMAPWKRRILGAKFGKRSHKLISVPELRGNWKLNINSQQLDEFFEFRHGVCDVG